MEKKPVAFYELQLLSHLADWLYQIQPSNTHMLAIKEAAWARAAAQGLSLELIFQAVSGWSDAQMSRLTGQEAQRCPACGNRFGHFEGCSSYQVSSET